MSKSHSINANQLTLLQNAAAYFPAVLADIKAAAHSIYLETYIFAPDATGREVANALIGAGLRGVSVRVLLDGFGSAALPQSWLDELHKAGVQVLWFRRGFMFNWHRHRLRRLHRKLIVIDGEIVLVGGINISDDGSSASQLAPRLDYAVRVQGEQALLVQAQMRHLWDMVRWASLRHRVRGMQHLLVETIRPNLHKKLHWLWRDNVNHRREIERAYLHAIAHAHHEIIIANAYFLPSQKFIRALQHATQRGVRVVLLLQGRVEYRVQHYATHALYEKLLRAQVEIYEYQPSFMHAKVAVIDGYWATVGSSNIDPFSLLLAREANLLVRDSGFARELRGSLLSAISADAQRISSADYANWGWHTQWLSKLSYGLIRMALGLIGVARR
ncbi:MAG: cardiolipin synthase ClsB [Sideroxydans sp.]|nr:cardiolipin synthase ClsB [Sideroxydans sp.]